MFSLDARALLSTIAISVTPIAYVVILGSVVLR
jgi:hypothetical protein